MEKTLIVLDSVELKKLEELGKSKITVKGVEYRALIVSGVFRGVVGNYHYIPELNSIAIFDEQRERFGLKPAKKAKR